MQISTYSLFAELQRRQLPSMAGFTDLTKIEAIKTAFKDMTTVATTAYNAWTQYPGRLNQILDIYFLKQNGDNVREMFKSLIRGKNNQGDEYGSYEIGEIEIVPEDFLHSDNDDAAYLVPKAKVTQLPSQECISVLGGSSIPLSRMSSVKTWVMLFLSKWLLSVVMF